MGASLLSAVLTVALAAVVPAGSGIVAFAIASVILAPLYAGPIAVALDIDKGRVGGFGDFLRGYRHFLSLSSLAVLGWGLTYATGQAPAFGLLAVYVAIAGMYAAPIVLETGVGPVSALMRSFGLVHRHFLDHLFQWFVVVLTAGCGVALFGIGLAVSLPLAMCILVAAYRGAERLR